MKTLLLYFLILSPVVSYSQDVLRFYLGANYSNVNYRLIDDTQGPDSGGLRTDYIVLPNVGCDIQYYLTSKFSLVTGLGVSWMGSKDYHKDLPDYINIDPDLKLGYLRVPIVLNMEFINNFFVFAGLSLHYNFRKNQGFFSVDDEGNSINSYTPLHTALSFGLRKDIERFSFQAGYHKGLSKVSDLKNESGRRAYLDLQGFQFSVGYLVSEK